MRVGIDELPAWVQLLATGVALAAWVEARMVLRRECKVKHDDVNTQLTARHEGIKELRNALQPLMIEVGKLTQATEGMHEEIRTVRTHIESKPCVARRER